MRLKEKEKNIFGFVFSSAIFAVMIFFLNSCETSEPVPSFIHIDNFSLTTDYNTQGSSNSKITDAWIYVDNELLGAYPLPASVPVLKSGSHHVEVRAGVIVNGIAGTRSYYPFYLPFDTTFVLTEGAAVNIYPHATYTTVSHFDADETFENSGVSFVRTNHSDTTLQVNNDASQELEGKCGVAFLDAAHPRFEFATADSFALPANGLPVYAELNYKCNNEFSVGVFAYVNSQVVQTAVLALKPTDAWKKVYVNLAQVTTLTPTSTHFKMYVACFKQSDVANPVVYFDNIKVIH